MENGSPLKVYADEMEASLQKSFDQQGNHVLVRTGMAYSKPYVWDAMAELEAAGATEILLLPMFPQYSTATTASVFNSVEVAAKKWVKPPKLHFVDDLFRSRLSCRPGRRSFSSMSILSRWTISSSAITVCPKKRSEKPIPREFANLGHAAIQ